jgi:hypothetical protein
MLRHRVSSSSIVFASILLRFDIAEELVSLVVSVLLHEAFHRSLSRLRSSTMGNKPVRKLKKSDENIFQHKTKFEREEIRRHRIDHHRSCHRFMSILH